MEAGEIGRAACIELGQQEFQCLAVGLAIQSGKLKLDDPVLKFFPEDAPSDPSENLKAMTVRDLLTMSAATILNLQGATHLL